MHGALRTMMVVAVFGGALACSKKSEPTTSAPVTVKALPPAAAAAAKAVAADQKLANEGKLDPNDPKHGTRKLMGLDAPVYIDGVQSAVFRAGELPPIKPRETESGAILFNMFDYLKGIGVDMAALKSVHFYGNAERIASIEGTEIRKEKGRFEFSFTSGDTGAPLQKWDGSGLKNEFIVHEIRRIAVYVKKPVPSIDKTKQCHTGPDGDCTSEMPYSDGVTAKGTRIYVDGKMVGFVKRRLVTDTMMVGTAAADPSDNKYAVAKLLAGLNVDVNSIKSVEVMAGDDVIARTTGERLLSEATRTTFSLPAHNHGKVRFHVPAEFQAQKSGVSDRDGLASAVLVYKSAPPAVTRDLVAISEDTDTSVLVAAIDDGHAAGTPGKQANRAE